ncbi:MAG: transcriptional regulator [Candidatus Hadarchaeota archaeon]
MDSDRWLGVLILIGSVLAGILYFGSFWIPWWSFTTAVKILVSIGFIALLGIGGWIGWTMASTPSPEDMGDIDIDEDFEEETIAETEKTEKED